MAETIKSKFSLYIRFSKESTENRTEVVDEVLTTLQNCKYVKVRFPRQKSANYCLVDFECREDCEKASRQLRKIKNRSLVIKAARSTDETFINGRQEKIQRKRNIKRGLQLLIENIKNATKKEPSHYVSNGIFIKNMLRNVDDERIKTIFPDAVEIHIVVPTSLNKKAMAYVTLPTPKDALAATKAQHTLDGETLLIKFQQDSLNIKSEN